MPKPYPEEFLARLRPVTAKRPRVVIDHILKNGYITTEELKEIYGYSHPPRAARDVREQGIPLETYRATAKDGRRMAAYRFADRSTIRGGTHAGRKAFPKSLKTALVKRDRAKCSVCSAGYDERYLQIDHRIPYEVAGDVADSSIADFMLICGSCNRAKSWSCEHCPNGIVDKNPEICATCYWASPIDFKHVATLPIRRLDLTWAEGETKDYDRLAEAAQRDGVELPEFVKAVLRKTP